MATLSPEAGELQVDEPDYNRDPFVAVLRWTLVLVVNLPLPWFFSRFAVDAAGSVGVVTGIMLFWLAGCCLALLQLRLMDLVVRGAPITACLQCLVIPHLVIGVIAGGIWAGISTTSTDVGRFETVVDGAAMTMIVGLLLCIVSLVFGFLRKAVGGATRRSQAPAAEPNAASTEVSE